MMGAAPDGEGGDAAFESVSAKRYVNSSKGDAAVRKKEVVCRQLNGSGEHLHVGNGADGGAGGNRACEAATGVDAHGARVRVVVDVNVVGHLDQVPAARVHTLSMTRIGPLRHLLVRGMF